MCTRSTPVFENSAKTIHSRPTLHDRTPQSNTVHGNIHRNRCAKRDGGLPLSASVRQTDEGTESNHPQCYLHSATCRKPRRFVVSRHAVHRLPQPVYPALLGRSRSAGWLQADAGTGRGRTPTERSGAVSPTCLADASTRFLHCRGSKGCSPAAWRTIWHWSSPACMATHSLGRVG